MSQGPYIFQESPHSAELDRLRLLESVFDPGTRRRLLGTGLCAGQRCLEVGAGAGSVATWMSEVVGPFGHVLAVDLNTRFLSDLPRQNVEVRSADIRTADIETASFDVVHARFVLIHVPDWIGILAAMTSCLKPGGWLVLEEPDFSRSRALAGPPSLRQGFDNVQRALRAMFEARGLDYAFGARLPTALEERGFEEMGVENEAPVAPGRSPFARMMGMSTVALRETYLATELASRDDIDLYRAFTEDPSCWATYHATLATLGRKPRAMGK